jgi:hypothetical protein
VARIAGNESGSRLIEVPEVTLGVTQNSEKFGLVADGERPA